jgi:hypothetical protein
MVEYEEGLVRNWYIPLTQAIADRITVHVKSEVQFSSDFLLAIVPDLILMSKTNPRFYLIVKNFTIIIIVLHVCGELVNHIARLIFNCFFPLQFLVHGASSRQEIAGSSASFCTQQYHGSDMGCPDLARLCVCVCGVWVLVLVGSDIIF